MLLSPLLGNLAHGLSGLLGALEHARKTGLHVVVQIGALGLLENLERERERIAHLLSLGSIVGLEAVNDHVVDALGERGAGCMGDGNHRSARLLGGLVGLHGLGSAAAERAGNHEGMLTEPRRGIVVELVSGEDLNVQLARVVGQEILGRVELRHRRAAADERNAVDLVVREHVRHNLLRQVHIDLVHERKSFLFSGDNLPDLYGSRIVTVSAPYTARGRGTAVNSPRRAHARAVTQGCPGR